MLKIQKSHQSEAVDGSLPSSKEHGSSHVAWCNVMHFRELDAFVALFECPELMSQGSCQVPNYSVQWFETIKSLRKSKHAKLVAEKVGSSKFLVWVKLVEKQCICYKESY